MQHLADIILNKDIQQLEAILPHHLHEINQFDVYGFTLLIEAAIVEDIEISKLLLTHGANPNQQDVTGGTALHWAAENHNETLAQLLLQHGANPNAHNFAGQPVLVMPILRRQTAFKKFLIQAGADERFALDYIHTKLAGHIFELVGLAKILSPKNEFVDVDFEGFYLEITLGLVSDSLIHFINHFAARKLRHYMQFAHFTVNRLQIAAELIKYQQYRVNRAQYKTRINELLSNNPLILPVGYEGHAITFIKYDRILAVCDRREDARFDDKIIFYEIQHHMRFNNQLINALLYKPQSDWFINEELHTLLGLTPLSTLKIDTQISGNCSWANVEAVIPALFFMLMMHSQKTPWRSDSPEMAYHKTHAIHFFHRWRTWNQERTLNFITQHYKSSNSVRQATKAELLVAILFQQCCLETQNQQHIEKIITVLRDSSFHYLFQNYLQVYYYENPTKEGKAFFELLCYHELI